jgi:hypothetical protein
MVRYIISEVTETHIQTISFYTLDVSNVLLLLFLLLLLLLLLRYHQQQLLYSVSKMGIFSRKKKNTSSEPVARPGPTAEAPPPPPARDILHGPNPVYFTARDPWKWVLHLVAEENEFLKEMETAADLPTGKMMASQVAGDDGPSPNTPSARGRRRKKLNDPSTLRIEIPDFGDHLTVLEAVHGTSEAFDGLEDKDELVRTLQRCRCEHLELSPPSRLINWDATKEECKNLVGDSLPRLLRNDKNEGQRIAVLKEPMGSGGEGVFFVKDAEEIGDIIESHRKRANDTPEVLDNLIAQKGRIPSWGKSLAPAFVCGMDGFCQEALVLPINSTFVPSQVLVVCALCCHCCHLPFVSQKSLASRSIALSLD